MRYKQRNELVVVVSSGSRGVDGRGRRCHRKSDLRKSDKNSQISPTPAWTLPIVSSEHCSPDVIIACESRALRFVVRAVTGDV